MNIDIENKPCSKKYIYSHSDGSKTAYLHYVDGMQVWEYIPRLKKWVLVKLCIGEKEVY
jgi:hypothetical protein